MTTRIPRTMLPPNLTRHFYEARRTFLKNATGQESTPWFQLTPAERPVVEAEMEIFRQAIRAAEEEQDLLISLNKTAEASRPTAEDTAAAADGGGNCACPGCSAVATLLALLEHMGKRLEASTPNSERGDLVALRTIPSDTRPRGVPLGEEEKTRLLQEAINDKIGVFLTAGIDLDVPDGTAPRGPWTFDSRPISVDLDSLMRPRSAFDDIRMEFWTKRPPTVDKA
ncbi:hypothetical protein [Streptomyces sp. NBC_01794]|uniref:hypothetical protein n=1 Tax=Streptomyces sp. NBC_01794 TaxID=2975942 RepID=UPI00308A65FB|nr:hypothetical protein OIE54_09555 [Streptomyces sp. NBC_01794]